MPNDAISAEKLEVRSTAYLLQELRETCERAQLGGYFYLLAVILAFLFTTRSHVFAAIGLTLWFTILAAARLAVRVPEPPEPRRVKVQLLRLWVILLITSVSWGAFSAWIFVVLPEPAPLISLLFSGAFGAAHAHTYCMRRTPSAIGIGAVMLPSLFLLWRDVSVGVGVMWAIYVVYMLLVLMRSAREYHARLSLEAELRDQRDLFEIQSRTDALTGIFNRRTFANAMTKSLQNSSAAHPISLLIMDIDLFKSINDSLGHLAGDDCLVSMANRMKKHFNQQDDVTGRLGGEEFGVILKCDVERAHERAEQFRRDLDSTPLTHAGGIAHATVSIGCGSFDPTRHRSSESWYREVDVALYKAKKAGRNRTETTISVHENPAGVAPAG